MSFIGHFSIHTHLCGCFVLPQWEDLWL